MADQSSKKPSQKAKPKSRAKPKAKEAPKKRSRGAPTKYKPEYNEQAYKLCLLGAIDATLADFFDVAIDTISEWKNRHPEFSASIKRGKHFADAQIASSLYEKAKGCTIKREVPIKLTSKTQALNKDGEPTRQMIQTESIKIVQISEELPPDTVAAIFWLKNRQPKDWRDKQEVLNTNLNLDADDLDYSQLSDETLEEIARIKTAPKS